MDIVTKYQIPKSYQVKMDFYPIGIMYAQEIMACGEGDPHLYVEDDHRDYSPIIDVLKSYKVEHKPYEVKPGIPLSTYKTQNISW